MHTIAIMSIGCPQVLKQSLELKNWNTASSFALYSVFFWSDLLGGKLLVLGISGITLCKNDLGLLSQ